MAIERHETYYFEEMYYVVGFEQTLHFQQLFKILELLEFDWVSKCHHIPFGRVKGMPSRRGGATQYKSCCVHSPDLFSFQKMPFFSKMSWQNPRLT